MGNEKAPWAKLTWSPGNERLELRPRPDILVWPPPIRRRGSYLVLRWIYAERRRRRFQNSVTISWAARRVFKYRKHKCAATASLLQLLLESKQTEEPTGKAVKIYTISGKYIKAHQKRSLLSEYLGSTLDQTCWVESVSHLCGLIAESIKMGFGWFKQ